MSTRTGYKTALGVVALLSASLLAGCGDGKSPFAGEDKQFGQTAPKTRGQPVDKVVLPPDGGVPPGSADAKPKAKPPKAQTPAKPDVDVEPEVPDPDVPTLDADDLIENSRYGVVFDVDSLTGIRTGSYRSLPGMLARRVEERLVTSEADGLTVAQTFGDGVSVSRGIQDLQLAAADADLPPDATSTSGAQMLDRRVAAACPAQFVCAERLTLQPTSGAPALLCFYDAAGSPALFPYGAVPSYAQADFDAVLGVYGPYRVDSFADVMTDCAAPQTAPSFTETVTVTVDAPLTDPALSLHTIQPLPIDAVVRYTVERAEGDLTSPYLDETIGLNHHATYMMSKTDIKIVKLIVSSRMSVDIARESGGGIIGGIADMFIDLDGIEVDLHFELCKDLLAAGSVDHCGREAP